VIGEDYIVRNVGRLLPAEDRREWLGREAWKTRFLGGSGAPSENQKWPYISGAETFSETQDNI